MSKCNLIYIFKKFKKSSFKRYLPFDSPCYSVGVIMIISFLYSLEQNLLFQSYQFISLCVCVGGEGVLFALLMF